MRKMFTILKISKKSVETKYGTKEKFNIQGKTDRGTFWADSWVNKANHGWHEGLSVEADIEPREYNGKTYYTVRPPSLEELILERLVRIESLLSNRPTEDLQESGDDDGGDSPPDAESEVPF